MVQGYVQSIRQLPFFQDMHEYETEVKTGILFFMFLSYLRGFIFVGTSFLNSMYSTTVVALFGIIPLFFLLIPSSVSKLWEFSVEITSILWFLAIITPNLFFRTIIIMVGTGITYGGLRRILTGQKFKQPIFAVAITVALDLIFRVPTKGADPLASASLIQVIFAVFFLFLVLLVGKSMDIDNDTTKSDIPSIAAVIGIFFVGFDYMMFFANPGVLTLIFGLSAEISTLYFTIITVVIALDYLCRDFKQYFKFFGPLFVILMAVSILTYPWYNLIYLFGLVGYLSTLFVLVLLFRQVTQDNSISPRVYSITFVVSLLLILAIGLQMITTDGMIWYYITAGLSVVSSIMALIPIMREGMQ